VRNKSFGELKLDEYREFLPIFANDVYYITLETSVAARNAIGGRALEQVAAVVARGRKLVGAENER
jgi:argininosuccinate lyase